jgi:hypothetical protein
MLITVNIKKLDDFYNATSEDVEGLRIVAYNLDKLIKAIPEHLQAHLKQRGYIGYWDSPYGDGDCIEVEIILPEGQTR